MKKLLTTIMILATSMNAFASIQEVDVQCEQCSSYTNAAKNASGVSDDVYRANVFDIANKKLITYRVTKTNSGGFPNLMGIQRVRTTVKVVATDATRLSNWNKAMNTLDKLTYTDDDVIPSSVVNNAWNLVGDNNLIQYFKGYVYSNHSIQSEAINMFNFLSGAVSLNKLDITISLVFPLEKGGQIVLEYSRIGSGSGDSVIDVEYKINWEESKDAEGNPLSLEETDVSKKRNPLAFPLNSESYRNFLTALQRSFYRHYQTGNASYRTICRITGDKKVTCETFRD